MRDIRPGDTIGGDHSRTLSTVYGYYEQIWKHVNKDDLADFPASLLYSLLYGDKYEIILTSNSFKNQQ